MEQEHEIGHAEDQSGKARVLVSEESLLGWLPGYELRTSWIATLALIVLISMPFWLIPFERLQPEQQGSLPLFLTIAWYFIMSWFLGRLITIFRGPPVLGFLISGFCLQYVFIPNWSTTRSTIQLLAFLIVLCRAGLEIAPQDLNRYTIALGVFPVLIESFGIGFFAMGFLNFSFIQGVMLGLIMSCIGDGLVLPKLSEYKPLNLGNAPRFLMTAAPLEVVVTLFTFGIFEGFSNSSDEPLYERILVGLFAKFFGTIIFAFCVAFLFAQLAKNRGNFSALGRSFFTNNLKEELLLILASVLVIYAVCDSEPVVIYDGISHESALFQSDMAVIIMMFFYGQFRHNVIHELEHALGEIWMFGALFLFTTLGSNIKITSFAATNILPVMFVGFTFRFVAIVGTTYFFQARFKSWTLLFWESLFMFVCSIPRATIQGALCRIPTILSLFSDDVNLQMLNAGVFVLALCAPIGSVIMDAVGVPILQIICDLNKEFPEPDPEIKIFVPVEKLAPIELPLRRKVMMLATYFFVSGIVITGSGIAGVTTSAAAFASINLPAGMLVIGLIVMGTSIVGTYNFYHQKVQHYYNHILSQAVFGGVQIIIAISIFAQIGNISGWIQNAWAAASPNDIVDIEAALTCCGLTSFNVTTGPGAAVLPCPPRANAPCLPIMISSVNNSFNLCGGLGIALGVLQLFFAYRGKDFYLEFKTVIEDFMRVDIDEKTTEIVVKEEHKQMENHV